MPSNVPGQTHASQQYSSMQATQKEWAQDARVVGLSNSCCGSTCCVTWRRQLVVRFIYKSSKLFSKSPNYIDQSHLVTEWTMQQLEKLRQGFLHSIARFQGTEPRYLWFLRCSSGHCKTRCSTPAVLTDFNECTKMELSTAHNEIVTNFSMILRRSRKRGRTWDLMPTLSSIPGSQLPAEARLYRTVTGYSRLQHLSATQFVIGESCRCVCHSILARTRNTTSLVRFHSFHYFIHFIHSHSCNSRMNQWRPSKRPLSLGYKTTFW
jgi:hypothetical protein